MSWELENSAGSIQLDPNNDPVQMSGYNLIVSNVSAEYEGVYKCVVLVQTNAGEYEASVPSGCLYVAGIAIIIIMYVWS